MYAKLLKRINQFDEYTLILVKDYLRNKYLDLIMRGFTILGNLGLIWFSIAFVLLANKPYRLAGEVVILTLFISTFVGEVIIKQIVRRIRPCNKNLFNFKMLVKKPMSYSFPSGHTLTSFASAEVLSVFFTQYSLMFLSIALLISLSRIYLYVHFPSDVIAGMLIGIFCSRLVLYIQPTIWHLIT